MLDEQIPGDNATTQTVAPGDAATQTAAAQAPDVDADRKKTSAIFSRGYSEGEKKGAKKATESVLAELGVESLDELRSVIEAHRASTESQVGREDLEKSLAKVKAERLDEAKRRKELEAQVQRFAAQAGRALAVDVKTRLYQNGAHEGVDDLVRIITDTSADQYLAWNSEGTEITVFEHGEVSGMTLEDFLADVRQRKPWFFKPTTKQGSGDVAKNTSQTKPPGNNANLNTLSGRLKEYAIRRG